MQRYYGHGQPGSPFLLYNYLRTHNTLQMFVIFFLSCFFEHLDLQTLNGLKKQGRSERRLRKGQWGQEATQLPNAPLASKLWTDL